MGKAAKTAKKNPQDATLRNIRALKRRVTILEERVKELVQKEFERTMEKLNTTVIPRSTTSNNVETTEVTWSGTGDGGISQQMIDEGKAEWAKKGIRT